MFSFELFKSKDVEVIDHWYVPIDQFKFSTQEFYNLIEQELKLREVPDLEISRVDFCENNFLSTKRQYLRLSRERLVFDICAAPFGTSYFFSCRFAESPFRVSPTVILFLVAFGLIAVLISMKVFGLILGILVLPIALIMVIWFLRNLASFGMLELERAIKQSPAVGPLYQVVFQPETYYRVDTRLMYLTTVNTVVKDVVERITATKGVKLLKEYRKSAPIGSLSHEASAQLTQQIASEPTPRHAIA